MPTNYSSKIRFFIAHNLPLYLPENDYLCPIDTAQHWEDDIAELSDYCELRAQYAVWKNGEVGVDDYVGFFHHRRYLSMEQKPWTCGSGKKRPRPYNIQKFPKVAQYEPQVGIEIVENYEALAPVWEYTGISVLERFGVYSNHCKDDLLLVAEIIREKYPDYTSAMDTYLQGLGEYYGNLYIMQGSIFARYCTWLFDILQEFDNRKTESLPRVNGYLGERLFGIYFTWLQQNGFRCGEVQRVDFSGYDDENHNFFKRKIINFFLPPGTKRRCFFLNSIRKLKKKK